VVVVAVVVVLSGVEFVSAAERAVPHIFEQTHNPTQARKEAIDTMVREWFPNVGIKKSASIDILSSSQYQRDPLFGVFATKDIKVGHHHNTTPGGGTVPNRSCNSGG
jgi:hypothetical protein